MASASVKALEQPTVEVATGTYRVVSTLVKVQTQERRRTAQSDSAGPGFRQIVGNPGWICHYFFIAHDKRHFY